MTVDLGAEIYPLEFALGVYRAPPAAQEAYKCVTIISDIEGEKLASWRSKWTILVPDVSSIYQSPSGVGIAIPD